MAEFAQYDPRKITLSWNGVRITGFAPGTFIKGSQNSPTWTHKVGAQGDVVRQRSNDNTGRVEFTLLASASVNAILSARHLLDKQTGLQYGPLLMEDLNGTTRVRSSRAWLEQSPDIELADEAGDRAWVLVCADYQAEPGSALIV